MPRKKFTHDRLLTIQQVLTWLEAEGITVTRRQVQSLLQAKQLKGACGGAGCLWLIPETELKKKRQLLKEAAELRLLPPQARFAAKKRTKPKKQA